MIKELATRLESLLFASTGVKDAVFKTVDLTIVCGVTAVYGAIKTALAIKETVEVTSEVVGWCRTIER